ncbi:hypothetical protein HD806DRAFT_537895 [Xylariaceae sp. AK1471]|nr:hypothetical protein HD806DRAFT_537895 [Xylariaceae sp. AK1471]
MQFIFAIVALTSLVIGAIADFTVATGSNVTGPFLLRITGKTNSSIDAYAKACHAGAGQEGLCYDEQVPADNYFYQFFYNYTLDESNIKTGYIIFILFSTEEEEVIPSAMRLEETPGSNVNLAFIPIGFDNPNTFSLGDDGNFYVAGLMDDRNWNETKPEFGGNRDLANFHLCWQWAGLYWYYSVAWVTTLPPQNPSCQPVNLRIAVTPNNSYS